ncbi:MAG: phospholipase D-like domain-containing protein [Phycisphaerae bacterium]
MYELSDEQFDRHVRQFERRDPELFDELKYKVGARALRRESRTTEALLKCVARPVDETEAALAAAPPALIQAREAETIVRQHARPVMVIRDNRATTEFLGPDSQVWAGRVLAAQAVLDKVIPAVGRVEVNNNPDYSWLGTGWLVSDDIIVTNRHVAREFARLGPDGFRFRLGVNGTAQSARLDFLEEYERAKAAEFSVESILWIAAPSDPDVAFLRVRRTAGQLVLAAPISLAESVNPDELVATIGYPARDSRVPDQDLVRSIFGDVYEKKRLAPGQIIEVKDGEVEHDCSTLGGNSGSPVVRLATGEAVGLHFSGVFMTANYAVAAPTVKELLGKVQRNELPGTGPIRIGSGAAAPPDAPSTAVGQPAGDAGGRSAGGGEYTFRFDIPIEITVRVGGANVPPGVVGAMAAAPPAGLPGALGAGSEDGRIDAAVQAARQALKGYPGVVEVRRGYRFKRGWITNERVVVVELRRKRGVAELRASGAAAIPPQFLGVGVDVRTAALADQLSHLNISLEALEAPPRPGSYREPPDLPLEPVKEPMRVIFHASPDCGFPNLRAFLGRVRHHLTATMYEWEAEHISDTLEAAIHPGARTLRMVTQKKGTAEAVADMRRRLGGKMSHVWASVGRGLLIPMAYHIKVASRDGEEVWLSSGNWKESNQPDIDPAGQNSTAIGPLRKYNREWHAIVTNERLATLFQRYIEWDFQEAQRVPVPELVEAELPDLFIPVEALAEPEAPVRATYFDPLVIEREIDIQPLLTPDRDARGRRIFMAHAVAMAKRAERSLLVQNQSFNLLDENVDEFEEFFGVLRDKQRAGKDVRIIFRDPREFRQSNGVKLQKMLESLQDFGLDTQQIKLQLHCHTKGIIVDEQEVMLGSHNLTNLGGLYNRDASLLVRDSEVTKYFKKIFEADWVTLAQQSADEHIADVRVAMPGERTPPGFRRVSMREALGLM